MCTSHVSYCYGTLWSLTAHVIIHLSYGKGREQPETLVVVYKATYGAFPPSTGLVPQTKRIIHFKMKILSCTTHPQVVSNLYEFLSSSEQKDDILKFVSNQTVNWTHRLQLYFIFPTIEVNGSS